MNMNLKKVENRIKELEKQVTDLIVNQFYEVKETSQKEEPIRSKRFERRKEIMNNDIIQTSDFFDLESLHQTVKSIIGKKCWRVNFIYGDEICFHFGEQVPYDSPLMKGKKGEWIFCNQATHWYLFTHLRSRKPLHRRCLVAKRVSGANETATKPFRVGDEGDELKIVSFFKQNYH